jgi:flagellar biosynthetic protein FliP
MSHLPVPSRQSHPRRGGRLLRVSLLLIALCGAVFVSLLSSTTSASALAPAPAIIVPAAASPAPVASLAPIAPIESIESIAPISPISPVSSGDAVASPGVTTPAAPSSPNGPTGPKSSISVSINGVDGKPSQSIVIILMMTLISVAPAALMLCTSFTKIIVVLSLTRNALGLQTVPPNQVLVGLALFLSLFIMGPTFKAVNKDGVQPYLNGQKTVTQAYDSGVQPLKTFMLKQTRKDDLSMMIDASKEAKPASPADVSMTTLVPAFVLSELRAAFIIGFVIFIPFLIIDLVVSSSLMSMGMMMLPPSMISLPFKLLLFVMVDGWALIAHSLIASYH